MENAASCFLPLLFSSPLLLKIAPFSKTLDVWYSCLALLMIYKGTESLQNVNFIGIPVLFTT